MRPRARKVVSVRRWPACECGRPNEGASPNGCRQCQRLYRLHTEAEARESLEWYMPETNHQRGSKHHSAKLEEEDIPVIRKMKADGEKLATIAKCFGVALSIIWEIVHGKAWRHVE